MADSRLPELLETILEILDYAEMQTQAIHVFCHDGLFRDCEESTCQQWRELNRKVIDLKMAEGETE